MLLFARFVVWVGDFLPEDAGFARRLRYVFDHKKCKQKIIAWHKAELEKLDSLFQLQQDSLRLVVARKKALTEGVNPMPRYPDVSDFSEIDWDEEAKVHSGILKRYKKTGKERMERLDEALRASKGEGSSGSGTTTP